MAEKAEAPKILDADALIDEIIAKKGPYKYTEGLSEDNWEEELEQIPLFMTKSPTVIDEEKAPGLAALRDLKYETSTPEGRAASYKEEGNNYFRLKKYKEAIEEYTAGIKEGGGDLALRAVLYTNRAAAQFHLGNLRSCLKDVKEAKKLKPDHQKALHRGAVVCVKLRLYQEAIQWCDEGLLVSPEDGQLKELRLQASRDLKRQERDRRRQAKAMKEKEAEKQKLLDAIQSRNIELASSVSVDNDADEAETTPTMELVLEGSHPSGEKVHLEADGSLMWPVMFLYPEHGQTDLISAFHEDHRFKEHVEVMFSEDSRPAWDKDHHYTPDNIQVFFEDCYNGGLVPVHGDSTLKSAISTHGYVVGGGTPTFYLLAKGSPFTLHFLEKARTSFRKS